MKQLFTNRFSGLSSIACYPAATVLLLLFICQNAPLFGQNKSLIPTDSLKTELKTADSLSQTKKKSDIDSVVYSKSNDSLFFYVKEKKMDLFGGGELRYKETNLKAGDIRVDFTTNNVDAKGVYKDSTSKTAIETPILVDKGEEYQGSKMKFNFKTSKGFITFASTKNKGDESAYAGAKINKIDKKTFFVENGIYTTCDAKDPHYCFLGSEMKVIQKEQMVGKWVWLTFGGVPFPIPLPFVVVPLESGRRSGLIPPAYGESGQYGRYFSHIGYFWAISDLMDLSLTSDYYTKGGYGLQSRYRYASRYNFNGYLEGSYSDLHENEKTDPDRIEQKNWRFRIRHDQTITPSSSFNANLEFSTSNFFRQNSTNYDQLLQNDINSGASYLTSWEETGTSLSLNYSRTQNLSSGNISETLPSIYFTKSTFYPFRSNSSYGNESWYELLGISYNSSLLNQRNKVKGNLAIRGGAQHSLGFSFTPKVGVVNVTPSFSYRELWYNKRVVKKVLKGYTGNDTVVTDDSHELSFVRTYSMGVGGSTRIYGIVQPQMFGVAAIRHIMSPSLSYNFTPDFSKDKWKYYDHYTLSNGTVVKYNKFEREVYGGASASESQSMNFRMDNLFELKTMVDPRDTTSKEKKIQLMNVSGDLSYNFKAPEQKFSDVNLGYRTQIGSLFNLSGGSTYSLYDYDTTGKAINSFLYNNRHELMRMKSFNFSASFNYSAERVQTESGEQQAPNEYFTDDGMIQDRSTYKGLFDKVTADFSIPWTIGLNYNYSLYKPTPFTTSINSTINGSLNFNLTPKWKFSVSGSYDIRNKQVAAPQVVITRDLHCWIMNFTWHPIGQYTGYRFEIRVKAPQLQDLKITKSENIFSGRQ